MSIRELTLTTTAVDNANTMEEAVKSAHELHDASSRVETGSVNKLGGVVVGTGVAVVNSVSVLCVGGADTWQILVCLRIRNVIIARGLDI